MAFDYRQFLAENKLTKVSRGRETGKAQILSEGLRISEGHRCPECGQDPCVCECDDLEMMEANKQKEAYEKRKEREEKGNWAGSVGAFVEKHGEDIANLKTFKDIDEFIISTMSPELNDEAYEYVMDLREKSRSPYKFIMSLYNATLKGSGLGLNEEDDMAEEPLMEMAVNHASLGGERTRKKPGQKPGTANQDKMAKSEMKGETIDVTLNGVTKAISTRAYNKFRKMTDPEEKKAWKKKYGFIK